MIISYLGEDNMTIPEISNKVKVVAIDGPSGSGKSTLAKMLAHDLGLLYIDTGAMFRAVAYAFDKNNIEFTENEKSLRFLSQLKINYAPSPNCLIMINGEDVSEKIREHHISQLSSLVSTLPSVRLFLLRYQRELAQTTFCVMEGRDIGTVVFPNACCKLFVTASDQVRANRRLNELVLRGNKSISFEQVLHDMQERDRRDEERATAPLKQASDAILIDTSKLELSDVLEKMKEIVRPFLGHKQ